MIEISINFLNYYYYYFQLFVMAVEFPTEWTPMKVVGIPVPERAVAPGLAILFMFPEEIMDLKIRQAQKLEISYKITMGFSKRLHEQEMTVYGIRSDDNTCKIIIWVEEWFKKHIEIVKKSD